MTTAPTTERTNFDSQTLATPLADLLLRVVGGEHHGRVVRLQAAKCTIGSAPGCTLRLRAPGIEPLHALILRGPNGTIVRKVGDDLELNGRKFEDAPLRTGDRLKIGPISFVVGGTETAETPRPNRRIVTATQQREIDRNMLREARQIGHQRVRKAVAALRRNRESLRELAYQADRRKHELDRLVAQMSQVQRDLSTERERHLHDLDQQRNLGLQVSQLSHSLERLRQEALSAQTKHQAETDHWRMERSRLTEDIAKREHQFHQLQSELQRKQWDLDQLQSQNERLQRQLELEHEQANAARVRFQQEHTASQLERTRAQEELLAKDRQLAKTEVELQLRLRETEKLRESVERLQKQVVEEQQQLRAELERRDAAHESQERDRLAGDVVARDRQIGELQAQLVAQQGTVAELREELTRRKAELADLQSEANRVTQSWEIERLQIIGKVSEAAAHDANILSERQQAVIELEQRLLDLEKNLQDRDREIEAQRTELQQLRDDRDRRLDETRDWQDRLMSKEMEVEELRRTNSELSVRLSSSHEIEQTVVVPMLAGASAPRLPKELSDELEERRNALAERERELSADQEKLAELRATLTERQNALEAAESELAQERQAAESRKASLQAEQDRLSAAARNLIEQERALVQSQEENFEKERQLQELQQQLESQVHSLEAVASPAVPVSAAPTPAENVTPPAVSLDSVLDTHMRPEGEHVNRIGIDAVDFSSAQAELESLRGQLMGHSNHPSPGEGKSIYEPSDEIVMPTADTPLENNDRRFRRSNQAAIELPPTPIPAEEHAALSDAALADGLRPAPDVTPDSLPQWSYEHEQPERMDTIVGLRMRNLLQGAADSSNDAGSSQLQSSHEGTTSDESTGDSSVDSILSRLRDAGILKRGEESSQPLTPPPMPAEPAVDSYQSRYQEPVSEEPEPEPSYVPAAPVANPAELSDEDDSIEAYMQQLMSRVRGDQAPSVSTSGPNPMYKAAAAPLSNTEKEANPAVPAIPVKPVTPEEYVPRSQAPEQGASLAAMRELANSQARSAINVHQKKVGKQQGGAKVVLGFCAIGFGVFAAYYGMESGTWGALVAAVMSASLGGYWLLQAFWMAARSLVNLPQRMSAERPKTNNRKPPQA